MLWGSGSTQPTVDMKPVEASVVSAPSIPSLCEGTIHREFDVSVSPLVFLFCYRDDSWKSVCSTLSSIVSFGVFVCWVFPWRNKHPRKKCCSMMNQPSRDENTQLCSWCPAHLHTETLIALTLSSPARQLAQNSNLLYTGSLCCHPLLNHHHKGI